MVDNNNNDQFSSADRETLVIDDTLPPELNSEYVDNVEKSLISGQLDIAHDMALALRPADIADLIEFLDRDVRSTLIEAIGCDLSGEMLTELEPRIRDQVLSVLEPKIIAAYITNLDTSDAVYLVENLPPSKLKEVLSHVSGLHRVAIEQAFQYPENSVARIMRRDFLTLPAYWTVGQTVDFCMASKDLPEKFYEIYVVSPNYKPVGSILLTSLIRSHRDIRLEDLAEKDYKPVSVGDQQEDVAYRIEHYRLSSVPVLGHSGRIIGVVLVDDVVEIIQSEAEDDIKQLAGVGGEELSDDIQDVVKNRAYWLGINLITAILAAVVITYFGDIVQKYVVLAALGPLVASMGGNAGSQTLTLAIRGIATRMLTETNMRRTIRKEMIVGVCNGVIFAIVAALLVFMGSWVNLWDADYRMGIVMAAAMLIQLIVAAFSGIAIPLALRALKIDPAISAVVFVTTVTDVVGFFGVLGLASVILV
ncbi:MAG: magnesium transporter [Alphaproteobacteria bacterium]|jgi:magnesium transporter